MALVKIADGCSGSVEAAEYFPGSTLAQLVVVITAINAWNRMMLAGGMQPPPLED